jgi:hypothetical protein
MLPIALSSVLLASAACNQASQASLEPSEGERGQSPTPRGAPTPAGSTCQSRDDCMSDQACVDGSCRYRITSRAGEVLAVGARGQMEAGDYDGALATFEEAVAAFQAQNAPLPPEVACGAAIAALEAAEDERTRERAAQNADRCFRNSLPGDRDRARVQAALARLRFDGLELTLFDRESAPAEFFTREPTRPTADAIQVSIDLPESEQRGFAQLREGLLAAPTREAIGACFVADWESRHERSVTASLVLEFASHMRDMGDYDLFEAVVAVSPASQPPSAFETCLAERMSAVLSADPRSSGGVTAWQEAFRVEVRLP